MIESPSAEPELSPPSDNVDRTLRAFAEVFLKAAGPALGTMLNERVTTTVVSVEPVPESEVVAERPLPWVLLRLSYGRGLSGEHHLVLARTDAAILAHALLGERDLQGAEELDATHEDALRAAANQIAATVGPSLTPLVARSVAFAPATLAIVDDEAAIPWAATPGAGVMWVINAELSWGASGLVRFALTTDGELAAEMGRISRDGGVPARGPEIRTPEAMPSRIDLILDITLPVTVELGRARMQIQDILKLGPGSIVELEKSAGDPVELLINDRPIARGEVVVIDENFGVRLTSIVTPTERIRTLR